MSDMVTIRGFASADVVLRNTQRGEPMATLRFGSTERRHDRLTNEWVDGPTNWFTVTMFRGLAQNVASSVHKGDRIIVIGKLRVNKWLRDDGRTGTSVDIEAESVGGDLVFGTCNYRRSGAQRQEAPLYVPYDGGANGHGMPDFGLGPGDPDHDDNDLPADDGGADDDKDVQADEDTTEVSDEGESVDEETGELLKAPF